MRPRVYLETSVVSYLTALPSRDLIRAAHQQITVEWWAARQEFDLFVSQPVLDEIAAGDPTAAARRLAAIEGVASAVRTARHHPLSARRKSSTRRRRMHDTRSNR